MYFSFKLHEKEVERLISIVRSHNAVLRSSGDWPERKIDQTIFEKLLDIDYERRKLGK